MHRCIAFLANSGEHRIDHLIFSTFNHYGFLQLFVYAEDFIACFKLVKSKKDLRNVDPTSICAKTMKQLNDGTKIGEYSLLHGGEYGRYLDIGSFAVLGKGIVAGEKVRIGDGVCIGDGVQLKNNARVDDETAIHIEKGQQKALPWAKGQRYTLQNGKCMLDEA